MTEAEWIDKIREITDALENSASMKLQKDMAYHKGYVQACEDFGKEMRYAISQEQG